VLVSEIIFRLAVHASNIESM
jgi:hypothetical protein